MAKGLRFRFGRRHARRDACPQCAAEVASGSAHCDACGYDLVTRTRASAPVPPVR